MDTFFTNLEVIPTSVLAKNATKKKNSRKVIIWEIVNEIKPIDMYCYLYAKYGSPNGLQNLLRNDSSDNLIHWEWSLASKLGVVSIQGQNFRTEVFLIGEYEKENITLDMFIHQIKYDFKNFGKLMKSVRINLEKWTRFLNPYYRINSVLSRNLSSLKNLELDIEADRKLVQINESNIHNIEKNWRVVSNKYNDAIGLSFGIRSMLPVLAESFINLIIFILSKPEVKNNDRLFQNTIRQQIDIRIQSLHLNCRGFINPIDYTNDACKKFHTLMNERNDLLHGNVEINKLKIGEVFFNKKVPVFICYEDFWQKTMGVSLNSVRYSSISDDYNAIKTFIDFVLSHLSVEIREQVEFIMSNSELGYNSANGRLGSLFSERIVDFRLSNA